MTGKLVSVITGTYNRPRELMKCIQTVREQTYYNIEHCIVHDGPAQQIIRDIVSAENNPTNIPIKFVETGRQWSETLTMSISAVPYQVAQWLASGDYLMWLADDEELDPMHVEKLVDLLEQKDVDFVYSQTQIWFNHELGRLLSPNIIGSDPPVCGQITHALFRYELLDYRGFMTHVGSGTDWDQVSHWMQSGASWAFLQEPTHSHRVDKLGDRGFRTTRLPLRGTQKSSSTVEAVIK